MAAVASLPTDQPCVDEGDDPAAAPCASDGVSQPAMPVNWHAPHRPRGMVACVWRPFSGVFARAWGGPLNAQKLAS